MHKLQIYKAPGLSTQICESPLNFKIRNKSSKDLLYEMMWKSCNTLSILQIRITHRNMGCEFWSPCIHIYHGHHACSHEGHDTYITMDTHASTYPSRSCILCKYIVARGLGGIAKAENSYRELDKDSIQQATALIHGNKRRKRTLQNAPAVQVYQMQSTSRVLSQPPVKR